MGWKKLILFGSRARNEATEDSDRNYPLVRKILQSESEGPATPGTWRLKMFSCNVLCRSGLWKIDEKLLFPEASTWLSLGTKVFNGFLIIYWCSVVCRYEC